MSTSDDVGKTFHPAPERSLRLWPGVAGAVLICVGRYVLPALFPDAAVWGVLAAVAGAAVVLLWWLFFSRARWSERVGAIVVVIVAALVVRPFVDKSILGGMMGMMYPAFALPPVVAPA